MRNHMNDFDNFESKTKKMFGIALVLQLAALGVGIWAVVKIVNWLTAL